MKEFRKVLFCVLFVFCISSFGFAATLTVTKIADTNDGVCDTDCSLREAIAAANSSIDDDEIIFDSATFNLPQTITLSGTELTLSNNGSITITGPGASLLTIDGNDASRVMSVTDSTIANIFGLTITGGNGVSPLNTGRAGGLYNAGGTTVLTNVVITGNNAANGAGLNNASSGSPSVPGDLTLRNCIVSNNIATGTGGGLQNFSTSILLIENSTFMGNVSNGTSGGGGMGVNGFVTVSNSTFVGNSAPNGRGGGLQSNGSLFVLNNVTVTGNSALTLGGGYYRSSSNANNFIRNSIIAGNTGGPEAPDVTQATGGTITSEGNNIIGVVGTSVGWVASDLTGVDAKLSPVGNYGGFGMTVIPMSDSPAINAGQNCVRDVSCATNNPATALAADQRGADRDDATVDIGAYETNAAFVAELPSGSTNVPYNYVIAPNAETFTYGISSGTLPSGINLITNLFKSAKNNGVPSGTVSLIGTPSSAGTSQFSLTVTGTANTAVVNYSLTIEGASANASIAGQVVSTNGGLSNALVTISDGATFSQTVLTNTFGYFSFDAIPTGTNYTITVRRKGYSFDPLSLTPTGNVIDLEVTATSGS